MYPKKLATTVTEREGINYVRSVVEQANCIYHNIDQQNDFGIDAIIEMVDGTAVTGISIALQIKSGNSYCSSDIVKIPADKKHFLYWINHSLTLIGIVYDPKEKSAYWINITEYLKSDRKLIENGPYTITISKNEITQFNDDRFRDFFGPIILRKPIVLKYDRSIHFAYSDSPDKHRIGLYSLLNKYRDRTETWDAFLNILSTKPVNLIDEYLIYILSLAPGHTDIVWHEGNTLKESIAYYVKEAIISLSEEEIIKILSFVIKTGFLRGTIGQCVEAIISIIPNRGDILRAIVSNKSVLKEIRCNALYLLAYYEQTRVMEFLSYIIEQDWEISEKARWIKHCFDSDGYVDFYW